LRLVGFSLTPPAKETRYDPLNSANSTGWAEQPTKNVESVRIDDRGSLPGALKKIHKPNAMHPLQTAFVGSIQIEVTSPRLRTVVFLALSLDTCTIRRRDRRSCLNRFRMSAGAARMKFIAKPEGCLFVATDFLASAAIMSFPRISGGLVLLARFGFEEFAD